MTSQDHAHELEEFVAAMNRLNPPPHALDGDRRAGLVAALSPFFALTQRIGSRPEVVPASCRRGGMQP